ncbi:uncharacterized protein LOC110006678 [Amborella trichopoda]|uniref:uncharacterized protein LOC110006678 n=1 Tax=Amborella trichopoda TaxID=13333 RepID=UPI0009C0ADDE|nr:uncharacterized protein LOC110006678 [Amborella trichopoda]|eukprot:XP_020518744.1 uncharacterized protein LOC110006678 [Amborella trichopoda]
MTKSGFRCGKPGHLVKDCPVKEPENQPKTQGQLFSLTEQEAKVSISMIQGTLSVCNMQAKILVDPGSSHSFVAPHFACHMNAKPALLDWTLVVWISMGGFMETNMVYKCCGVLLEGTPLHLISALRASQLLAKRCVGYLAYVIENWDVQSKLEEIPVVREYPEDFPKVLTSLPLVKEVEFEIDVVSSTAPISKAPYRMAPVELKELKEQLQELLAKGFI